MAILWLPLYGLGAFLYARWLTRGPMHRYYKGQSQPGILLDTIGLISAVAWPVFWPLMWWKQRRWFKHNPSEHPHGL
jgi:hypothetical protein